MRKSTSRRQAIGKFSKFTAITVVAAAAGTSFPAFAVWEEVARGIATGIAEYARRSFEALTAFWEDVQRSSNDKISQVKTKATDQLNDFTIAIENRKRVQAATPLESQCVEGVINAEIIQDISDDQVSKGRKNTFYAIASNNLKNGSSVASFGPYSKRTLEPGELLRLNEAIAYAEHQDRPLTQKQAADITTVLMGDVFQRVGRKTHLLVSGENLLKNPAMQTESVHVKSSIAQSSLAAHVFTSNLNVEPGQIGVDAALSKKLNMLSENYSDAAQDQQKRNSMNEVALAAELVRQVGDEVFVTCQQYHENDKMIAAMSLIALNLIVKRGRDV